MKYLVSPGKCVSDPNGDPHPAGSLVELPDDVAKRLLAKGSISDPRKPLIADPGVAAIDNFKRNPPAAKAKDADKNAPKGAAQAAFPDNPLAPIGDGSPETSGEQGAPPSGPSHDEEIGGPGANAPGAADIDAAAKAIIGA